MVEHRRLEEVAVLQARTGRAITAGQQFRAILPPDLDVVAGALQGRGLDERSDLGPGVEATAEPVSSAPNAYRISPRRGAGARRQSQAASSAARTAAATSDASEAA